MLDSKGVSSFPTKEPSPSLAKPDINNPGLASKVASSTTTPVNITSTNAGASPIQVYTAPTGDYSAFQFQGGTRVQDAFQPLPTRTQPQQNTPPGLQAGNLMQGMNATMERIAGQVISFFFGNRREKPLAAELKQRELNDFFTTDMLGERKVEEGHKGQMDGDS